VCRSCVLPFGAVRSVHSFLRLSRAIWWLGTVGCKLMWTSFYDDFISYSRPVLVAVGCAHLHGTHHMSSIHSPQHPFSSVGGLGFLKQFFMRTRKLHWGCCCSTSLVFCFQLFMRPSTSNFFCRPNLHTKQRCRVVAALPYGVLAFSSGLA
jgi:hypothetical protein